MDLSRGCAQAGRFLEDEGFIRFSDPGVLGRCPTCGALLWWTTPDNKAARWPSHFRGESRALDPAFRLREEGADP